MPVTYKKHLTHSQNGWYDEEHPGQRSQAKFRLEPGVALRLQHGKQALNNDEITEIITS